MPITVGSPLAKVGSALIGPNRAGNARGNFAIDIQTTNFYVDDVASGNNAIVIGSYSRAYGTASIAIGKSTRAPDTYGVAIGTSAYGKGAGTVAIGFSAAAKYNYDTAIGGYAKAYGYVWGGAVSVGHGARTAREHAVAVGHNSYAFTRASVAVGYWAYVSSGTDGIAIGNHASAYAYSPYVAPVVIGLYASAYGGYNIAIGSGAKAAGGNYKQNSIAIGHDAHAYQDQSVAIGYQASAPYYQGVALGSTAMVYSPYCVAIGPLAKAVEQSDLAIGCAALASSYPSGNSIAIGRGARADSLGVSGYGVVIGSDGEALYPYAVAVGAKAYAKGYSAIALGSQAHAIEAYGIAIGQAASVQAAYGIAIGAGATVYNPDYIVIGNGLASQLYTAIKIGFTNGAYAYWMGMRQTGAPEWSMGALAGAKAQTHYVPVYFGGNKYYMLLGSPA